ncbi:DUF6036 family nucleotidyltransferase [Actinocorallia populi]|uniref:DUF6036 family nucleotidyltransferase n=1 Tax=Actinocorallia populi TaxID=2079200 RepID=UPI000D08B584|nr:DUF6036 family nucleotidyltransferase [Actinocorallia populi]
MKRSELDDLLTLIGSRLGGEILVVGSQAILAAVPEEELPAEVTASIEVDVTFLDGDEEKADIVDGALGEYSRYHEEHDVYAQGVGLETAKLPAGWRDRLVRFEGLPDEVVAFAPDPHDLAAAKAVAGREKDAVYVLSLIKSGILDIELLFERLQQMPAEVPPEMINMVSDYLADLRSATDEPTDRSPYEF